MSADSLRKQSKQVYHGQVILPQPINDLSLIESVAGFIHEVVPQAYSSVLPGDSKDGILWARFDSIDYNDPENFPQLSECESESTPPLLLVLGYSSGVQVWSVGGSGEATELLSWCQGAVRALRFLLRPQSRDPHSSKRPLVAIVDSSSPGPQFATLSFISLKTADVVKIIKFNSPICDVHCNKKSIVITFSERIAVFDSATLEDRLTITTCYPSPGNTPNPIALGPRWLAYGEKRLTTWQRSSGGCEGDGAQSYTSTVIHAAKSLGKGLRELGGSLTGSTTQSSHNAQAQPGIVSIIDIERKCSSSEEEKGNMIAHFVAHTSAVVAMAFDPSGMLLVTADKHGHRFNVFRIHSHPCTSQLAAVHHLYVLHRGETTARVQDITVSWDSRWVAVSSVRGTTHVFPITPYGGLVTVRTHTTSHVVNKLSRFERSAGLRDGRGSPLPCETPSTPPPPRLPPYPHPSIVSPLAQLRARPDDAPLAAYFGPPRAWLPGKPKSKRTCADSLYIIYSSGAFMQYDLDPKVVQGVPKEKISFDTPIELGVEAKAEWILPKPPYTSSLCPPLPLGHVLLDLPPRPQQPPDKWLSQVEIVTHTGPHRRLWMGPQFNFKSIDPLPMSGCEGSDIGPESANPLKSNPVNMPHRPFLLVEIGSGSPQMAEVDEAGGRLREDLADAMLETQNASGQTKGKLKRAEVEWQVNPLGAVQTHPSGQSHWPHPIFFEPYSQEHYKAMQQPSAQKSVEDALQRIKLQAQFSDPPSSPGDRPSSSQVELAPDELLVDIGGPTPSQTKCDLVPSSTKQPSGEAAGPHLSKVERKPLEASKRETTHTHTTPKETLETDDLVIKEDTKFVPSNCEESGPDKSSNKQEGEDKPKTSGKKNRKKRNGSDKKTKKEHQKLFSDSPSIEPNIIAEPEVMVVEPIPEMMEPVVDTSLPECCEIDIESNSVSEILEMTDDPKSNFESKKLPEDDLSIEEPAVQSGEPSIDQDVLFPFVSGSKSVIACGVIEITEEESLLDEECLPLYEVTSEQKVETKSQVENIEIIESLEVPSQDVVEHEPKSNDECHETTFEESSAFEIGKALLEEALELPPPLTFNFSSPPELEPLEISDLIEDKDLNGNNTFPVENINVVQYENPSSKPLDLPHEALCSSDGNVPKGEVSTLSVNLPLPSESEDFITVSSKSSRNKNRRKKKDKKQEEVFLSESSEKESSESAIVAKEDDTSKESPVEESSFEAEPPPESICSEMPFEEPSIATLDENSIQLIEVSLGEAASEEVSDPTTTENKAALVSSLKSSSLEAGSSLLSSDDIQSDQVVSTDRSEVEDVSSHSGKESDDSKIAKKERSRKQKRSESSDKDRSELKKKSPSPAAVKSDSKDSESSDEAGRTADNKQCTPKIPKRKKGKKNEELPLLELPTKSDDRPALQGSLSKGSLNIPPKDKSSESSVESSSESRPSRPPIIRNWNHGASSSDQQIGIEDRDSVYESCNDDGASDSLAFESSKEDFDDGSSKTTVTEPSSSNAEEKTDSCDKTIQPLKKVRKQKKKKR